MNRISTLFIFVLSINFSFAAEEFSWHDTEGKYLDLKKGNRLVARYQYEAIDESTPERRHDTYKPFHHIYDWEGKQTITKGPGGKFTHHRGIYYGFSKCSYTDESGKEFKNIDTWHCKKAHQVHRQIIQKQADADHANMISTISWISDEGVEFIKEKRTMNFSYNEKGDLVVEAFCFLTSVFPKTKVDGDPQHAGFQFRATNEVAANTAKQTYYIRPKTGKDNTGKTINWSGKNDTESTRDLPWKAMSFVTGEDRYTVLYIDSPTNPKPARYSERDYGRFGSYFAKEFTPEEPLIVQYKLVIRKGEMTSEEIETLVNLQPVRG